MAAGGETAFISASASYGPLFLAELVDDWGLREGRSGLELQFATR